MRLTEERKTGVIGFLLSVVLLSQIIQGIAGGKQHAEFNRINWLLNHSNKALALLDNLLGVVILDKENRAKNFENYQKSLNNTYAQHQQMSIEERQLLGKIDFWGLVEQIAGLFSLVFVMIVMWLYLRLTLEISKRIK